MLKKQFPGNYILYALNSRKIMFLGIKSNKGRIYRGFRSGLGFDNQTLLWGNFSQIYQRGSNYSLICVI